MADDIGTNPLIQAADNHNIANGGDSWFDKKINAVGELTSDVGEGIRYGLPGAVVAGVNSFINSGIAVANFVGGDIEPVSTYETLKNLDDNLGDYYQKHKAGVETAGFILGSIPAGMTGVWALNAAKAGFLGTNFARASGLMTSLTANYASKAAIEFASGASPFSVLNANVIKSLAQGVGSSVLEMAAFETTVAATMFKSPTLEQQSFTDALWTIGENSLLWGGVGGVLKGVGTIYKVKGAAEKIAPELFPYRNISEIEPSAGPELKIINYAKDKFNMPEAKLMDGIETELSANQRMELITKERTKTLETLDRLTLQEFQNLSGGDAAIANQLNEKFKSASAWEEVRSSLLDVRSASRISEAEKLVLGDVQFPLHRMDKKVFDDITSSGNFSKLFANTATANTQGYRVTGNLAKLAVADSKSYIGNAESAFADGFDVFRNPNGFFSINPASKILERSDIRRLPNNLIVDFERNGTIVDKAVPGLADLSSAEKPIVVQGNTVLAGELNPIRMGDTLKYSPLDGVYTDAQARTIWAQEQKINRIPKLIGENDLPLLERIYYAGDEAKDFSIKMQNGLVSVAPKGESLANFITRKKLELAQKLDGAPIEEISHRLNVSESWLQGQADELAKIRPGVDYNIPRYAKMNYDPSIMAKEQYNANNIDGMINYLRQVNLIEQRHMENAANYIGELYELFPEKMNWADPGRLPTSKGAGASLFGFANANAGTPGGWSQFVGSLTDRLETGKVTAMAEKFNPAAANLPTPALRAELDAITNRLRAEPMGWVWHPVEPNTLIPKREYFAVLGSQLRPPIKPSDVIKMSPEVADFGKTHMKLSYERQIHIDNMKGAAGLMSDVDHSMPVWYPPPIDTERYKHFMLVEPREFTIGDKKRIVVAKDEATLMKLVNQIDPDQYRVYSKAESEAWHKAAGDYQFALGMNESRVDSSLGRKGVLSDFFAGGNGERILDDYLNWHIGQEKSLAKSMVYHNYAQSFEELKHLGRGYTNLATSQFRSLTEALEKNVKDPYYDIIKTSLNISRASEYKYWTNFNEVVRNTIEGPLNKLRDTFRTTQKIDDSFVSEVNTIAKNAGLGTPFKDAASLMITQGNIADKPFLAKWIAKAQALMSTTLLQLDTFNALNNVVSTPILGNAEMQYLINGIRAGDPKVAGKLANLLSTTLPDGSHVQLPSTGKLMANAVKNSFEDSGELLKRYQKIGADVSVIQQERMMIKHLTLDFKNVTGAQAESAFDKAVDFGRKWSGNTAAESYSRFLPADMMRQVTDLAIESGVLKNVNEANEFIYNFVNKVQGNYLYSQRPIVFQGVVGQAVSLFQTYQFNLMQQLFKYVGEGDKKSLAMLLGLQGSIYGLNGLPAFNFLNTHIVGNASGNSEHKDLFAASQTVFGRELGSWLMYGAGSNALGLIDPSLKINIYSRGDINPRQVTVLPATIQDIPVVNASVKFVGNILQLAEKLGNGAEAKNSLTQAIEHNGLSRPLAGLAQVIQGYTTTTQSSLLSLNQDFASIATLSRVLGGKPFDEAVALDALYRINAYKAKDLTHIQELGSAIKTSLVGGRNPSPEEVTTFAQNYMRSGGRIDNFNKFMAGQMVNANKSQVNKLAENLNSPYAKQLQIIMGGQPLPDFLNSPTQ